jgi:hypothetical protein
MLEADRQSQCVDKNTVEVIQTQLILEILVDMAVAVAVGCFRRLYWHLHIFSR